MENGPTFVPIEELNDLAEIKLLEKREGVDQIMRSHRRVAEVDTQFARQLNGIFMRTAGDVEKGWEYYTDLTASTYTQQMALTLSRGEFEEIHAATSEYVGSSEDQRTQIAIDRLRGQIGWNDQYELTDRAKRSLEVMRANGIVTEMPQADLARWRPVLRSLDEGSDKPLIEHIKSERILTINDFKDSKVSLVIHDLFDHVWAFDRAEKAGILDRYSEFLNTVGNPHQTDVFKREGELVASTVFGTRLFRMIEPGYKPIISFHQVKNFIDRGGNFENQKQALALLNNLDPDSFEAQSFAFVVSNMAVELMEQRRKHGRIKLVDPDQKQAFGVLRITNPEYNALMAEVHHMVVGPKSDADENLLKMNVLLEEYVTRLARSRPGEKTKPLTMRLDNLTAMSVEDSWIHPDRIEWLRQNPGCIAAKTARHSYRLI